MSNETSMDTNKRVKIIPPKPKEELDELTEYEYYDTVDSIGDGKEYKITRYTLQGNCPRFDSHVEVDRRKPKTKRSP